MRKFFRELISKNNNIDEQAYVGVVSFYMMIVVLLVDVVTGIMAKELIIKEWIFEGFLGLTVGAFFINSAKSIMHSRKAKKQDEIVEEPTDTENLG
jgi:cytochrome b